MLASHPDRPLEYWFFKVNAGSVALLVDWIVRRKQAAHLVRVSLHSPQQRAVLFDKLPAPMIPGENYLTTERTAGRVGDISWALDIECADERIQPDVFPARLLRMTDVVLDSAQDGDILRGEGHVVGGSGARQKRGVFGRQGKALGRRLDVDDPPCHHRPEPLADVALVQPRTIGDLA